MEIRRPSCCRCRLESRLRLIAERGSELKIRWLGLTDVQIADDIKLSSRRIACERTEGRPPSRCASARAAGSSTATSTRSPSAEFVATPGPTTGRDGDPRSRVSDLGVDANLAISEMRDPSVPSVRAAARSEAASS